MNKSIGLGSFSLVLVIIGLLFAVSFGDQLIEWVGLKVWSNGNSGIHYTTFYSLPFFILAFFISSRYPEDFAAKTGKIIASGILIFSVLALLAF